MKCNNNSASRPAWLRLFVNEALHGIIDSGLIGCHVFQNLEADEWEVSLFDSPTEICGGPADGMRAPCSLQVDVIAVASAFDFPPRVCWQAGKFSDDDELANHLSFEGIVGGVSVWLRILQTSPPEFGLGRRVHAPAGVIEDVW